MKLFVTISLLLLFSGALPGQCLQLPGCPASPVDYCDLTGNNALLWQEAYWNAPAYQTHDLPEGAADLCITVADTCAGANLDIRYLLFLDLDGNGTQETVVNSANLPGFNTVYFDNAVNPGYSGGTPRAFDERSVPAGQRYGFAVEQTGTAGNRTACVRWNTADAPGAYVAPELPYGAHRIRWIVSNGLGNTDSCEYTFNIKDCKKPTVVCLNGLSANIMPTGLLTVWATDFLQYAEDNATPGNLVLLGLRRAGTGTGFPVDTAGSPVGSITFNCQELGMRQVELWARDLAGNVDYCEVSFFLQDNMGNCPPGPIYFDARICFRQWCTGAAVTGVDFGPLQNLLHPEPDGCYALDSIIYIAISNLAPTKDSDPLNGVDLLDLIKTYRHILGIEPLPTPFGLLAADVNRSGSVTTFDVVESRKLLTGIYQAFPNNTSWRFVDADFVFPNPANPFQTIFPEIKQIIPANDTLQGDLSFWAIKVGDVDCSSLPGLAPAGEDRAAAFLNLPDQMLLPGETVDIPVCFANPEAWLGFQMALAFDPQQIELEAVLPGNLPNWDDLTAVQAGPGLMNVVWFDAQPRWSGPDAPAFILRLRARTTVPLHTALRLAQGRLPAEGYNAQGAGRNLQLQFISPVETGTRIGAPQPNPTATGATLTIHLNEPVSVQIDVWDARGDLLWDQNRPCDAGAQQIELPARVFPAAGVYWWRVTAGDSSRSGRLLVR